MTQRPRILVICTGNRCRSQMAEGWLRHFAQGQAEIYSAGIRPKGVHPLAIQVMAEAGVDISQQHSKHLSEYLEQPMDVAVTVCNSAREGCPFFPKASRWVHHSFPDPDAARGSEAEVLAVFRNVRDQIRDWAERFIAENDLLQADP